MPHKACTYRGFTITSVARVSKGDEKEKAPLRARAVARRGRILIDEPQPVTGIWNLYVCDEIDRLLGPAILRDVENLN